MGKTREKHIGEIAGIFKIIEAMPGRLDDGHLLYKGICIECGHERIAKYGDLKATKKCTHYRSLSREQVDLWYETNKIKCLCCGEYIPFNYKYNFDTYKERKFCSVSCAATYNNAQREKHGKPKEVKPKKKTISKPKTENKERILLQNRISYCMNCGAELQYGRKYCSTKCQSELKYKQYIERWKNGLEDGMSGELGTRMYLKRYIKEKYNNQCAECGWHEVNQHTGNIPLEVHHIDGDYINNKEENLTLLCPNCHSLTETYRASNTGNGRDRKKYYK